LEEKINLWCTQVSLYHEKRKLGPIMNYNVKEFFILQFHVDKPEDVHIVDLMKKWNTLKTILSLQIISANIQNPEVNNAIYKTLLLLNA
jgi:hypothetical protein